MWGMFTHSTPQDDYAYEDLSTCSYFIWAKMAILSTVREKIMVANSIKSAMKINSENKKKIQHNCALTQGRAMRSANK